jgi:phospholipid/cholesterol/gamma-HCH transport system substrate-binding protein
MSKSIKVGLFVAVGIVLACIIVFLIGDERRFWNPKVDFVGGFGDVAGLKPGAPIRMGGVDVGGVTSVNHAADVSDARIYVGLSIVRSEAVRVREDTVAKIVNKGLLGDKMVELSVSEGKAPLLRPGAQMKTEEPLDFTKYTAKFESIIDKAEKVIGNVEQATRGFGDPKITEDLKGGINSLRVILDGLAYRDGPMHKLIFDPEEGKHIDRVLANLDSASQHLNLTASEVAEITKQVQSGPGLAHAVLYDGALSQSAAGSLSEVHQDLQAIREGNGLAHALIYGDSSQQKLMGNVNAMSDDLRRIVADVRAGKGTLGGLLVDPTIYEDIKSLVGNVERNQVLRALVRYSIKADENAKPRVEAPRPSN